jgi:hypothetical protein
VSDTDVTDAVNTVTVAAGDTLTIQGVNTGSPAASAGVKWSTEFVPDTATDAIYGGGGGTLLPNTAQNWSSLLCGTGATWSTVEADNSNLIPVSATIKAFYVTLDGTVDAGSYLFQIFRNGVAEISSNVTISSGSTGSVTGLSIAVAPGDAVSFSETPTSTPTQRRVNVGVLMTAGTNGESIVCGGTTGSPSTSSTNYHFGFTPTRTLAWGVSEGNTQALCGPTGFAIRDFRFTVATAPGAGKQYTFTQRLGGAATNLAIIISDSETSDTDVDSASFANGDLISIESIPSGTPAATGLNKWAAIQFITPPPPISAKLIIRNRDHVL